jgi:hypothetical protein
MTVVNDKYAITEPLDVTHVVVVRSRVVPNSARSARRK